MQYDILGKIARKKRETKPVNLLSALDRLTGGKVVTPALMHIFDRRWAPSHDLRFQQLGENTTDKCQTSSSEVSNMRYVRAIKLSGQVGDVTCKLTNQQYR